MVKGIYKGEDVAVKYMAKDEETDDLMKEIDLMMNLKHSHIIRMIGFLELEKENEGRCTIYVAPELYMQRSWNKWGVP